MKHYALAAVLAIVLVGLGVYQIQSNKASVLGRNMNSNLAAVSTATSSVASTTEPSCNSRYQFDTYNKNIATLQAQVAAIPAKIASTTKVIDTNKSLLVKAVADEAAVKKVYDSNKVKSEKDIATLSAALQKTLNQIASSTNKTTIASLKKTASSTEATYKKTKDAWDKIVITYTTSTTKREQLEKDITVLTGILTPLQNGTAKASLDNSIAVLKGYLVKMNTLKHCPLVEALSVCNDGIDNDFNGKTDCEDSNCSFRPVCTGSASVIKINIGQSGGTETTSNTVPDGKNATTTGDGSDNPLTNPDDNTLPDEGGVPNNVLCGQRHPILITPSRAGREPESVKKACKDPICKNNDFCIDQAQDEQKEVSDCQYLCNMYKNAIKTYNDLKKEKDAYYANGGTYADNPVYIDGLNLGISQALRDQSDAANDMKILGCSCIATSGN